MNKSLKTWFIAIFTVLTTWSLAFSGQMVNERRAGHILYKLNDAAPAYKQARAKVILSAYAGRHARSIGTMDLRMDRLDNMRGKDEEQICRELKASGGVAYAEPDYLVAPQLVPNDPGYDSQWFHSKINTAGAWDRTTGDSRVTVAVCDTGVEATHPDLNGNVILPGYNTVDGTTNSTPVHYHGTAVAGCMAAAGNNGQGVAGMAWSVKILPIRVSNTSDGYAYFSDIAEAVYYAADHGARVINISYGVGGSYAIDSAAQYARNKGALVFASAGNDGVEVAYPDFTSFVLVGATDSADAKASWSNFGTAVDITSPGASIYTTRTGATYGSVSGTSFSSPIAAGLAALIFSLNPSFTPAEVETFIFSTGIDLGTAGEDKLFGKGRINAAAAVESALLYRGNTPPVALLTAAPEVAAAPAEIQLDGSLSYDNDGSVVSYLWNFGDGKTGTGASVTHSYLTQGSYTVTLTVTDNFGESSSTQKTITITPDPTIIAAPASLAARNSNLTVTLRWSDKSNNEEGFYVERAPKTRSGTFMRVATLGPNAVSFSEKFTIASSYNYRVQAFNATTGKTSEYSNQVTVKVQ